MKHGAQIDNWMEITKYVHYIDTMIENTLKVQFDISLREFYVLYEIYNSKGKKYKINDLIKVVDLSQSAMSRLIVRLEKMDSAFVYRQECVEDQRAMYIYLTDIGTKNTVAAINSYKQLMQKVNFSQIEYLVRTTKDS